ncbi:MAG TPA: flagellar motor protein MotB [Clostridia bacterium]|nr:flagellar motor protein MotB [Clostridia bacterium]
MKKEPETDNRERYLLTYGDLMNLLLILFIVLFCVSKRDVVRTHDDSILPPAASCIVLTISPEVTDLSDGVMAFLSIVITTRRFFALFSGVSFFATGKYSP